MAKYYSVAVERNGTLEAAASEAMKKLCGKQQNEHGARSSAEFWRCQWQFHKAILARIEIRSAAIDRARDVWEEK